jgi:uncharacterized UPF0146 family protein
MAKNNDIAEEENIAFLDLSLDGVIVRIGYESMKKKNIDIGHCISLTAAAFQALRKSDISLGGEPLLSYYEPERNMKYSLRNTEDIEDYVERWARVYGAKDYLETLRGRLYSIRNANSNTISTHKRKRLI